MNVYDTQDPKILLKLKRLEADALLDVIRTINHAELSISQLCLIASNVLRAQLGVKKMYFHYFYLGEWHDEMRLGFRKLNQFHLEDIYSLKQTTEVDREKHPYLTQLGVEYVIPILLRGEAIAYFLIADFADSEVEAQNDLIFIETLGNILAVAIQNRQLFQEKMDQEFLKRELEVAEAIQHQLLISDFDRFSDIDVYAMNLAHHRVGGDFYDVIKKENGLTFVCIADVAGKGIPAALLMSNLQANLRALCAQYNDLISIIKELNRLLYRITVGEKFVTLFLGRIDPEEGKLRYINAGHNYPVFQRNQTQSFLDTGCVLLGIMPEVEPVETEMAVQTDDLLFAFTDGVVEQPNQAGELFGNDRLYKLLETHHYASAQELVKLIRLSLESYAGGVQASDDITMLGVRFT